MALAELFVSVLIAGVSCVNTAIPFSTWRRTDDARFAVLGFANGALVTLGAVWVWGQLSVSPPDYASVSDPAAVLVLSTVVLFLLASVWNRRV